MPDAMHNAFTQDARDNYDDCYWLKIKHDESVYKAFYDAFVADEDVMDYIVEMRKVLVDMVNQKYKEDVAPLKRQIMKLQMELNQR